MKQVIQNFKSGELKVDDVPIPSLKTGGLLVRNINSLISAGTEKSTVSVAKKSLAGKAKERPDQVRQVIKSIQDQGFRDTYKLVMDRLNTPVPLGYSCAGEVIAVGENVNEFQVGDRVACAGANYASHAEVVWVPKNLCVKIPTMKNQKLDAKSKNDFLSFEEAAFVTLGAIAMQGVRQANVRLGEKVAVIGLGLLGQITIQLLKASGCDVVGADLETQKLQLATELGADSAVLTKDLKLASEQFSNGPGVDAVIITAATNSNQPIELAGEIARLKGKVVVVGRIGMNIPRDIYYQKELELRLAMSYGPGRYDKEYEEKGHDYPYGYVRWTEKRNMESFLSLAAQGKIDLKKLITHRFKIEEVTKAYDMIMSNTESYLGVILKYSAQPGAQIENLDVKLNIRSTTQSSTSKSQQLNIGVIGCGNYARGVLLPKFKEVNGVNIKAICTERSMSAKSVADKLKCNYCTTDYTEILSDTDINVVLIVTRHNTHTEIVINSLKAGKHVFVEKPLALNEEELNDIMQTYQSQSTNNGNVLMVGFNRRFSPHAKMVFDQFNNRKNPLVMNYLVNAGSIPKDHWTQDSKEGGGRIIGEVCHFIDFLQFMSGAEPVNVYAQQIGSHTSGITNDNCIITIRFSDGSIGSISYIASGDTSLPKEIIKIFGDGSAAVITDFKITELYSNNKRKVFKTKKQDKGQEGEAGEFFDAVRNGKKLPINSESFYLTTLTTFKIHESLNTGLAIELIPYLRT